MMREEKRQCKICKSELWNIIKIYEHEIVKGEFVKCSDCGGRQK